MGLLGDEAEPGVVGGAWEGVEAVGAALGDSVGDCVGAAAMETLAIEAEIINPQAKTKNRSVLNRPILSAVAVSCCRQRIREQISSASPI